ncbi:MAG: YtxH domain-containing protein [Chloroflexi bacterium]|nr:MAG: YtxH domain-containing protein [Chloroflexota bacterium]
MEQRNDGIQFALGLALGVVAGVVATILLTPQAGRRTREALKESTLQGTNTFTRRLIDILEDEAERLARRIGDELLEAGRSLVERQQAQLRAGLDGDSGREYRRT